jgi:predicted peroxiredoxin
MTEKKPPLVLVLLSDRPTRVYPALFMATGVAEMGHPVIIKIAAEGVNIVKKDHKMDPMPGIRTIDQSFEYLKSMGVQLIACGMSWELLKMAGLTEETVKPNIELNAGPDCLKDCFRDAFREQVHGGMFVIVD